jgi:hypothetical protein
MKNYGPPKLSEDFFNRNPLKELSVARILYSELLYSQSGIDFPALASKAVRKFVKKRGKKEERRISEEAKLENLLKMMEQKPDPLNHWLLKKKILNFGEPAISEIIERLKDNRDDIFAELAISIIYESKIDSSSQLIGILDSTKDPYTLSLICLLLGLIGSREAIQPVWDYYHFFKT